MHSITIARLVGPLMLAGAAAVLLNRRGIQRVVADAAKNTAFLYLTGALSVLGGLAVVESHNVWIAGWPVLITILGWMAVIRGVARMLFPDQVARMVERFGSREEALLGSAVLSAVLGAILTIKGFF